MSLPRARVFILPVIAGLLIFLSRCTTPTSADGGTETGNAFAVAGVLYLSDGITRAARATVCIRPRSTLADTAGRGLTKRLAVTDSVLTNDTGYFAIDTIDTGMYVIEATSGDTVFALIDSVRVADPDSTVSVEDTLLPAGSITGVVYLSEGGDPRKVFILAFGINRFTMPDTNGVFAFDSLAEAVYDLRIISSLDNYGVLDTFGVSVVSEQATDLDTLRLPYSGIPTPKGLTAVYDTLRNRVGLSWSTENPVLVAGYRVYRRQGASGTYVPASDTTVHDTFFVDSVGNGLVKGGSYQYMVRAIDPDANEGLNSQAVTVIVAFYVDAGRDTTVELGDSLSLAGTVNTQAVTPVQYRWDVDGDGTNEFVSATSALLKWVYTDTGTYNAVFTAVEGATAYGDTTVITIVPKDTAGAPSAPRGVTLTYDTLKQIVTLTWLPNLESDVVGYNVYRQHVDSGLVRINSAPVTDTTYSDSTALQDQTYTYQVRAVDKGGNEGLLSVGMLAEVVSAFVVAGSFGSAGTGDGQFDNPTGLCFSPDSFVLVADVRNHRIQKFDLTGSFVAAFGTNGSASGQFDFPVDIAVDVSGNIYVADHENNRIQKFDRDFNYLAASDTGLTRPQAVALDSRGNLYVNEIGVPKIKKFDANLDFVLEWGRGGSSDIDAIGSPRNIAIDSHDRVYVVEGSMSKIVVFDTLGQFVAAIDSAGSQYFTNPIDISISGDKIAITDNGSHQIFLFNIDRDLLTKWGSNKEYYSLVTLPNGQFWASVLPEQTIYMFSQR